MNCEAIKRSTMMSRIEDKNGPVKIVKKIEPTYKGKYKPTKVKLDKMGRKIGEKNGMTLETARYITDMRIAKHLNNIF